MDPMTMMMLAQGIQGISQGMGQQYGGLQPFVGPQQSAQQMGGGGGGALAGLSGMPWGAIAGGGLGLAGGLMDSAASVSRRTVRGRGKRQVAKERARRDRFSDMALQNLQQGLGAVDSAKRELTGSSRAQKRQAADAYQGALGNIGASAASRGLGNTTFADQAKLGATSRYTADLQNIDTRLANLMSNLEMARGQQLNQMAQFNQGRAVRDRDLYGDLMSLFTQG